MNKSQNSNQPWLVDKSNYGGYEVDWKGNDNLQGA